MSILKACLAQSVFRGYLQGKPDGLQVPLGGFHLCFEVDKYSEMSLHLKTPPPDTFWQKLCVSLSSRSQIMERFSIRSVKEGSLVGHRSVSIHADKVGWQQSLWEHYRNLCVHKNPSHHSSLTVRSFSACSVCIGVSLSVYTYIYISGCIVVWPYLHSSVCKMLLYTWSSQRIRNRE